MQWESNFNKKQSNRKTLLVWQTVVFLVVVMMIVGI